MEDKDARDETAQEESTEGKPQPTSKSLREEMDELYERYGDAFRMLR